MCLQIHASPLPISISSATITLTASDGETVDRFAVSLDVSGDVMAVAASTADDPTGVFQAGVVYVLRRNGTSWTEEASLSASDPRYNAQFGKDVAIVNFAMGGYKQPQQLTALAWFLALGGLGLLARRRRRG